MNLGLSIYTMYNKLYTIKLTTAVTTLNINIGTNNPQRAPINVFSGVYHHISTGLAFEIDILFPHLMAGCSAHLNHKKKHNKFNNIKDICINR